MTGDSDHKKPFAASISSWLSGLANRLGLARRASGRYPPAFTTAFVSLAAKMAKADGVAVAAEWQAFERFLEIPPFERDNVRRVYDLAKRDTAGADAHAEKVFTMMREDPATLHDVLECLFYIACSDGILHPAEDEFLTRIARSLRFDEFELRKIRALFVNDPSSAYQKLGVAPDASDADVKAAYRAAVAQVHPDLLIAAGAPAALIKAANAKLAALNAAYEEIVEGRRGRRVS